MYEDEHDDTLEPEVDYDRYYDEMRDDALMCESIEDAQAFIDRYPSQAHRVQSFFEDIGTIKQ